MSPPKRSTIRTNRVGREAGQFDVREYEFLDGSHAREVEKKGSNRQRGILGAEHPAYFFLINSSDPPCLSGFVSTT
jgi:hypothetical protein